MSGFRITLVVLFICTVLLTWFFSASLTTHVVVMAGSNVNSEGTLDHNVHSVSSNAHSNIVANNGTQGKSASFVNVLDEMIMVDEIEVKRSQEKSDKMDKIVGFELEKNPNKTLSKSVVVPGLYPANDIIQDSASKTANQNQTTDIKSMVTLSYKVAGKHNTSALVTKYGIKKHDIRTNSSNVYVEPSLHASVLSDSKTQNNVSSLLETNDVLSNTAKVQLEPSPLAGVSRNKMNTVAPNSINGRTMSTNIPHITNVTKPISAPSSLHTGIFKDISSLANDKKDPASNMEEHPPINIARDKDTPVTKIDLFYKPNATNHIEKQPSLKTSIQSSSTSFSIPVNSSATLNITANDSLKLIASLVGDFKVTKPEKPNITEPVNVTAPPEYVTYHFSGTERTTYVFPGSHQMFGSNYKIFKSYEQALLDRATEKKYESKEKNLHDLSYVILVLVDEEHADMAINLYEVSFLEHNLSNYLFLCMDQSVCKILQQLHISAYLYSNMTTYPHNQGFTSKRPLDIFSLRSQAVVTALRLNISVLVLDVNVMLLRDPYHHFCKDCDVNIAWNGTDYDLGLYFVRPANASIFVHTHALTECPSRLDVSFHRCMTQILKEYKDLEKIKQNVLSEETFSSGLQYFEKGNRMWSSASDCAALHNNWIGSEDAKIYRFKEHHMWWLDKDGYYSNVHTKYLYFMNLEHFYDNRHEIRALQSALWMSYLLNRTLILPVFNCPMNCSYEVCQEQLYCAFNTYFHVDSFQRHFAGKYRENFFLSHNKVPASIKASITEPFSILSRSVLDANRNPRLRLKPHNRTTGATWREILDWFSPLQNTSVLQFQSLHHAFYMDDPELSQLFPQFSASLEQGIKGADYRQYSVYPLVHTALRPKRVTREPTGHEDESIVIIIVNIVALIVMCLGYSCYLCCEAGYCEVEDDPEYDEMYLQYRRRQQQARYARGAMHFRYNQRRRHDPLEGTCKL